MRQPIDFDRRPIKIKLERRAAIMRLLRMLVWMILCMWRLCVVRMCSLVWVWVWVLDEVAWWGWRTIRCGTWSRCIHLLVLCLLVCR